MNESHFECLCGALRWPTWKAAIQWILRHQPKVLIETGCYRGIPADGYSTLVLAKLSRFLRAEMYSFELDPAHIAEAQKLLNLHGLGSVVRFVAGDSVTNLQMLTKPIGFAYLDSFDHEEGNPLPSQQHQLKELEALLPLLAPKAAILMDDNVAATGGKPKLTAPRLESLGWIKAAGAYQLFYTKI